MNIGKLCYAMYNNVSDIGWRMCITCLIPQNFRHLTSNPKVILCDMTKIRNKLGSPNNKENIVLLNWDFALRHFCQFYVHKQYTNISIKEDEEPVGFIKGNIQLQKVMVLVEFDVILILSTCKFILKTISRYSAESVR